MISVKDAKVAAPTINTCIADVVPYLFHASDTQQQHLQRAVVASAAATAPTTADAQINGCHNSRLAISQLLQLSKSIRLLQYVAL
jgi:hypothetical protein